MIDTHLESQAWNQSLWDYNNVVSQNSYLGRFKNNKNVFIIQGKCIENKDLCLSFKEDWNGAPTDHKMKILGRQKKNNVGPWLWKRGKIEKEKVKCALRRRYSNCYWGKVHRREENMERSTEKKVIEWGDQGWQINKRKES